MKHTLPILPYSPSELEPYIDTETVNIHYSKHHQAYVDGLNSTIEKLETARKNNDFSLIKHLKRELAFHGSGHILHSLYWHNLIPNGRELKD
jgi:Fe-Mn family superoxide dismutase